MYSRILKPPCLTWLLYFLLILQLSDAGCATSLHVGVIGGPSNDALLTSTIGEIKQQHRLDINVMQPAEKYEIAAPCVLIDGTNRRHGTVLHDAQCGEQLICISLNNQLLTESQGRVVSMMPDDYQIASALDQLLSGTGVTETIFLYDSMRHLALANAIRQSNKDLQTVKYSDHFLESLSTADVILALQPRNLRKLVRRLTRGSVTNQNFIVANVDGDISLLSSLARTGNRVTALRIGPGNTQQPLQFQLMSDAITMISNAANIIGSTEGVTLMQQTEFSGLTGPIKFNENFKRIHAMFSLVEIHPDSSTEAIITFQDIKGLAWPLTHSSMMKRQATMLRVSAILTVPYVMINEEHENITELSELSKERYSGASIDLLDRIADALGFDYEVEIVDDMSYGSFMPGENTWNGMIGEIVNRRADIAMGDLTITPERKTVVDFTHPWLNFGIGLLAHSGQVPPNMFQFLEPFTLELWLMILVTFVVVSILFFCVARLSPRERTKPSKDEASSWMPFSLLNSSWFVISALFRQTPTQQPRSVSGRILGGVWWLFTFIVAAYYFATLIYQLSHNRSNTVEPIQSINDLVTRDDVQYGALYKSSTWNYFQKSKLPLLQRIYFDMEQSRLEYEPLSLVEAVEMVINSKGKYAYFMEEFSLKYLTERNCELKGIMGHFSPIKAYGLALQKGSTLLPSFNAALLRLKEDGTVHEIIQKWWKDKRSEGMCDYDNNHEQVGLVNIGGVFIVLVIGAVLAILLAIFECCCTAAYSSRQKQESCCGEVSQQLQQAVRGPPTPAIIVT